MDLLFSETGLSRLDRIAQSGVLCAFDFDGTLAPLVTHPEKAVLPPGILHRLLMLAGHAKVAIITGRALDDIRSRLGFVPDFLVGNHGLEGVPGWEHPLAEYRLACQEWGGRLAAALKEQADFDPGIWIENKGYSLSVHYRLASDHPKTEARLSALFATLVPVPRIITGKCVFNLLPQEAADKGRALERLMALSQASGAIYVGDDVTDEDAFRLRRPDVLSVRIGHSGNSMAEFALEHRLDMPRLLDELTRRVRQDRTQPANASGPGTSSTLA